MPLVKMILMHRRKMTKREVLKGQDAKLNEI